MTPVISSVLSDGTIRRLVEEERIKIRPWDPTMVQPASVDLRLGTSFRVFHNHRLPAIDLAEPPTGVTEHVQIEDTASFVIHPGEFVLGSTVEWVELPDDIVARIEGKSSLGRLGLIVHATAGFVDPGFSGTLTLEITNLTRVPIILWPGKPIAQLSFMALDQAAERPYGHPDLGSHYHGQLEATESRYEGGPADDLRHEAGNTVNLFSSSSSQFRYREQRMREMESNGEQTHFTKRVTLPSGKTIEVVYFADDAQGAGLKTPAHTPAEPVQDLHVCVECDSELVYPVQWEEAGPENWSVLLHCPNCEVFREGVFTQDNVELFDEELDRGADALARDYKRLMRANMADEIERFTGALAAGAILPEDF